MKKISILILSLFFTFQMAQSAVNIGSCPQKPYDVSNKFSQVLSQISGTNFFLTKTVELVLQSQIKKEVGAKGVNVELIPYSAGDLISGKFKKVSISTPSASKDDIAFSNFKAESVCEFSHIIVNKDEIKFAQNFLMDFSLDITNDDLEKITLSEKYKEKLEKVKVKIANFSLLKMVEPKVEIKDEKLQISFGIETPLLFSSRVERVVISSKLKAKDGKIELANLYVNTTKYDANMLLPIINLLNPLSFETKISNNLGIAQIKNVDIIDDKISLNGVIFVPKNHVIEK